MFDYVVESRKGSLSKRKVFEMTTPIYELQFFKITIVVTIFSFGHFLFLGPVFFIFLLTFFI
jgi:hypothetical protein